MNNMVYLITYTFFGIGRINDKEKKEKNIGHIQILTTVRQAVRLQESLLNHSATTYDIYTRAIDLYTLYLYSSD